MNGLLQISDPHFGTEQPGAVDALLRLAQQQRPRLVVVSGDITQRATTAQFAAAQAFVQRLAPVPVLTVPGNHDIPLLGLWARLTRPYAHFEAVFGPVGDRELAVPGWHVVGLNTTRRWRHKNGEVSARQVAFAAGRLRAAAPAALKVVVTHQPLAVADAADRGDLLRGAARARRVWAEAGVDLVLGGHIHLPFVLPLHAEAATSTAGDARPMWAVQAGTALSTRVRPGTLNSVTELCAGPAQGDGGPQSCSVRFWDWAVGQRDFVARAPIELALASRPAA